MNSLSNIYLYLFLLLVLSCKTDKKQNVLDNNPEVSVLEKVANAHGFKNWKNVNHIQFTFNVDRDTTHFERTWIWKPKINEVTRISGNDSLTFNRKAMDSIAYKANAGFINDRYWLLAPFNLIWDKNNFKHTYTKNKMAPIAKKPMNKLTIVYGAEGGYTPGDAYDFYFENDYLIKEWVFRKANQATPSMTTTWENYVNHNGFKFAMEHKQPSKDFKLFFNNIQTSM